MGVSVKHSTRYYVLVLDFVEMLVGYIISWLMENPYLMVFPKSI